MFPTLRAEMARYNIKTKDIAELLKLNRKTVSAKLSGKAEFTIREMWAIRDKFFPSILIDNLFVVDGNQKAG